MHRNRFWIAVLVVGQLLVLLCVHTVADPTQRSRAQVGWASWYGSAHQGRKTASGEPFSTLTMTAAHRQLPLGTKVLVNNLETGQQAEVKITDRGPYGGAPRRIIDLSRAAAEQIGLRAQGVGRVEVAVTELPPPRQGPKAEKGYEVQVGAFKAREQAQTVLAQVQARHPVAYVVHRHGPRGPYYRVRVGPFGERPQAQRIASVLEREGHCVFVDEVASRAGALQLLG
jgi:peptidoglycan lytic transglycosylase